MVALGLVWMAMGVLLSLIGGARLVGTLAPARGNPVGRFLGSALLAYLVGVPSLALLGTGWLLCLGVPWALIGVAVCAAVLPFARSSLHGGSGWASRAPAAFLLALGPWTAAHAVLSFGR